MPLPSVMPSKSAFGWGSETESQNATGGYSTQLSEDTGSEIVGHMTSIQDIGYRNNEALTSISTEITSLKAIIAARNTALDDLQEGYCIKVLEYLQDILKYTKDLTAIKQFVETISNKIKDI